MAKLDEIAELLTEEIHNFEQSVEKLETLQTSLKDYKLEPDASLVNKILWECHESQRKRQRELENMVLEINSTIEKAQTIPGWQVKLFWAWSFLNLLGWGITIVFLLKI